VSETTLPQSKTNTNRLRLSIRQRLDSGDEHPLKKVQDSLESGANPNRAYDYVFKVVEKADLPLLKLLLAHGLVVSTIHVQASISNVVSTVATGSPNYDVSLLHVACGHSDYFPAFSLKIVKLLLDHGSDVNGKTLRGWTPLMYICWRQKGDWKERLRIAELLLDYAAEPDTKNGKGRDCLYYAGENKSVKFERLIRDYPIK
jgi:ankyrin repeat protein